MNPSASGGSNQSVALPEEVLYQVFTFLPPDTLNAIATVCKEWHRLATDQELWKRIYCRAYDTPDSGFSGLWKTLYYWKTNCYNSWHKGPYSSCQLTSIQGDVLFAFHCDENVMLLAGEMGYLYCFPSIESVQSDDLPDPIEVPIHTHTIFAVTAWKCSLEDKSIRCATGSADCTIRIRDLSLPVTSIPLTPLCTLKVDNSSR